VIVLAVFVGVVSIVGLAVGIAAYRWPALDPAAPQGAVRSATETVAEHRGLLWRARAHVEASTAAGLALGVSLALVVLGGVGLALVAFMVRTDTGLARADRAIAEWGAAHASTLSTDVLRSLTQLGSTIGVVVLALVVAGVDALRSRHASTLVFLTVVLVGESALANLIKVVADRARPAIDPLAAFAGASFPSGHATASAAGFAAFALVLGRRRSPPVQAAALGLAAALAVGVATTRVLLGVHWLTDVLAGLALGWMWFALCAIAFGGRLLRLGTPIEAAERVQVLAEDPNSSSTAPHHTR
jgi:undecaprenyl-diphosphatase